MFVYNNNNTNNASRMLFPVEILGGHTNIIELVYNQICIHMEMTK